MLYPTIDKLSKRESGEPLNRYELVIGVAKSARMVTDEFTKEFSDARQKVENRETDKPIMALLSEEMRNEKPVHIAINRIERKDYTLEKCEEK